MPRIVHNEDKSKTKKHTKDTREKSESDNVIAEPNLKHDASYIQSSLLNEVSQHEIDQFLAENSIQITDTSSENTAALRPIISFAHLPCVRIHSPGESLRINRPRPRGRPTPARAGAATPRQPLAAA